MGGKRLPSAQDSMRIKVCKIGGTGGDLCQRHFLVICGREGPEITNSGSLRTSLNSFTVNNAMIGGNECSLA